MGSCMGCEMEAANNERDFLNAKNKALEYSKENNGIALRIYKEFGEWKFISLEFAIANNIYGREVVQYSNRDAAVPIY